MQSKTLPSKPEQSINSDQDVLIVGAGPGGLAAALLLAHSGLKVRVVEKASLPAPEKNSATVAMYRERTAAKLRTRSCSACTC